MTSLRHHECSGVPLAFGKVRGARSFQVDRQGRLRPATYTYTTFVWEPGVNTVICDRAMLEAKWRSPGDDPERYRRDQICVDRRHSCGLWAYYDGSHYIRRPWTTSGVIHGYGRCEIGPKGFRASKADLVAVVCRDRLMTAVLLLVAVVSGWSWQADGTWSFAIGLVAGSFIGAWLGTLLIVSGRTYPAILAFDIMRMRRMRRYYAAGGVKVYSTRWWMLRRCPIDKVRDEWK